MWVTGHMSGSLPRSGLGTPQLAAKSPEILQRNQEGSSSASVIGAHRAVSIREPAHSPEQKGWFLWGDTGFVVLSVIPADASHVFCITILKKGFSMWCHSLVCPLDFQRHTELCWNIFNWLISSEILPKLILDSCFCWPKLPLAAILLLDHFPSSDTDQVGDTRQPRRVNRLQNVYLQ